jgi:LAO/AO transport system kinase
MPPRRSWPIGRPQLLEFGVSDEQAWQVGLACGGRVQVFVEPVE